MCTVSIMTIPAGPIDLIVAHVAGLPSKYKKHHKAQLPMIFVSTHFLRIELDGFDLVNMQF